MSYRTGFCGAGLHEGTRPKSPSGKPMKVCTAVGLCTCACHQKIDKMYQMTGVERVVQQNPDYQPAQNVDLSWMEQLESKVAASPLLPGYAVMPPAVEAPSVVVPTGADSGPVPVPAYAATPSGIRARGQLEHQVYAVCQRFMMGEIQELMTPKLIALEIDPEDPPSVGAIGAVLGRWEQYGFAVIHKNPIRFAMFTREGIAKGLEKMRADFKARSKR